MVGMVLTTTQCTGLLAHIDAMKAQVLTLCPAPKPAKSPKSGKTAKPKKASKTVTAPLPSPKPPKALPKPRGKKVSSPSVDDAMALMKATSKNSSAYSHDDLMLASVFNYKVCCNNYIPAKYDKSGKGINKGGLQFTDFCINSATGKNVIPAVRYSPKLYDLKAGNTKGTFEMWSNGSDGNPAKKSSWHAKFGDLIVKNGYVVFEKYADITPSECGTLK